jgi:hypothetical protein
MIGAKLTGSRCQCSTCREFFNSISVFDRHRVGNWENRGATRRCLSVHEMRAKGWRLNVRGFWIERSRIDTASRAGDQVVPSHTDGLTVPEAYTRGVT